MNRRNVSVKKSIAACLGGLFGIGLFIIQSSFGSNIADSLGIDIESSNTGNNPLGNSARVITEPVTTSHIAYTESSSGYEPSGVCTWTQFPGQEKSIVEYIVGGQNTPFVTEIPDGNNHTTTTHEIMSGSVGNTIEGAQPTICDLNRSLSDNYEGPTVQEPLSLSIEDDAEEVTAATPEMIRKALDGGMGFAFSGEPFTPGGMA